MKKYGADFSLRWRLRLVLGSLWIGLLAVLPLSLPAATKLSPPMVSGGNVTLHRISPDGSRAVYRADQDTDEVFEFYSVPLGGGSSVKISGAMVSGGDVHSAFAFTPDGTRVVFVADREADDVLELYIVPTDGSAPPTKLNGKLVSGGDVDPFDFEITPDGSLVVYLADQEVDGQVELYSRPIDGGRVSVKLNGPLLVGDGEVKSFKISSDSNRVAYRAIQDLEFTDELYSRLIDGSGSATKLNGPLVRGGDVDFFFDISPDGNRVVFRADALIDQKLELFSRPIDGSGSLKTINAPLASDDSKVGGFRITPDSSRIVYTAEQDKPNTSELYVRPIDGNGNSMRLSGPLDSGEAVFIDDMSPDGTVVVYLADQDGNGRQEAYSVPIDGSASPVKLNEPAEGDESVIGGQITPDSARYIFFADLDTPGLVQVYSKPIDGSGAQVKLSRAETSESTGAFGVSDDSRLVVLLDGNIFAGTGLFWNETSGGTPAPVNDPLPEDGEIFGLPEFAPDSRTVLYRASQDDPETIELYSVKIGGAAPDLRLVEVGFRDGGFDLDVETENFSPSDGSFRVLVVAADGNLEPLDPLLYSMEELIPESRFRFHLTAPLPPTQLYLVEFNPS